MAVSTEQELISRFQGGDGDAFTELVDLHQLQIIHLALQMLRDPEAALDVAQEVFCRVYEELPFWRGEAKLSTWLYQAALYTCFEQIRANEKARKVRNRLNSKTSFVPKDSVLEGEMLSLVDKAVRSLPERQRAVFILKQYQELHFRDIGELLEITEDGAKANYHKALTALRRLLAKFNPRVQSYNNVG